VGVIAHLFKRLLITKNKIMQNELVRMPFNEMATMAKMFAESGMFADAKAAGQAIVKIQAGQEIGIPPFAAMSGIHIIQGKPTIGAGLIASMVKGSGKYDYLVTEMTDKNCSIDFFQGDKKIGTSAFSITDATKAGTKNIDKFPKNMLFARAISNGVKWYCPDVFAGPVYVPEEMPDVKTEDVTHEVVAPSPDLTSAIAQLETCSTKGELTKYKASLPDIIVKDASFVAAGKKRYEVIMAEVPGV
jgi:hypothetical protein